MDSIDNNFAKFSRNCSKLIEAIAHERNKLDGNYEKIYESHQNRGINALAYIGVVLLIYMLALSALAIRYFCTRSKPFISHYPKSSKYKEQSSGVTNLMMIQEATSSGIVGGMSTAILAEELVETEI